MRLYPSARGARGHDAVPLMPCADAPQSTPQTRHQHPNPPNAVPDGPIVGTGGHCGAPAGRCTDKGEGRCPMEFSSVLKENRRPLHCHWCSVAVWQGYHCPPPRAVWPCTKTAPLPTAPCSAAAPTPPVVPQRPRPL